MTAGEGAGYFFNTSTRLDISQAITAESSRLHIGRDRTQTRRTFGFQAQVANR